MCWNVKTSFSHHDSISCVQQTRSRTVTTCCRAPGQAFGIQYRQRLATCILTEGIRPLIWPWQLLHDTTTYLKVVNMGTSKAGLPKTFIIRPCLPLVASTRNRDRNIFKNPRCSCRTSACVSFAFVCRLHDSLMFQCRYFQFQVCSLYQLQSRGHKFSRVLPGPQ